MYPILFISAPPETSLEKKSDESHKPSATVSCPQEILNENDGEEGVIPKNHAGDFLLHFP